VILLLPHDGNDSIGLAQSIPNRPSKPDPAPSIEARPSTFEESSLTTLPPPDPLPTPSSADRAVHSDAAVPLNIEIRCEAEIESACPEGPFEERRQCMQERLRQLSVPCRQRAREHLMRMKVSLQHIRTACEADVRRFCQGVEPGRGSILQCLETHAQEVSDLCFGTLPKRGRLMK
jgi:Cysteine rich repeat